MFALVDCNSFFASCEEVFNPKLKKKALVILSNNDGIVIARSKKAKAVGVKMGQPAFEIKELIQKGKVKALSSNFNLYADMSERVMETLSSYSPDMEIYSIDEAFFRLEKSDDLWDEGRKMVEKVKQWTGIPISIGIAPTKTLAKLANEMAKKEEKWEGVSVLTDSTAIEEVLSKTEPKEIWGIGNLTNLKLHRKKIFTALQLKNEADHRIQKILGIGGLQTVFELRGTPCFGLMEEPEKKKSIVCSRSFSQKIESLETLEEAVASFTARAAEKLRDQESLASFLSVFITSSLFQEPYVSRSCHVQIPNPTSFTPDLIALAKEGLSKIFQPGISYKRAGILLTNFVDEQGAPTDFLDLDGATPQKAKAMKTVDAINSHFDKRVIRFAAEGIRKESWGARSSVSPQFTTNWNELLKIN